MTHKISFRWTDSLERWNCFVLNYACLIGYETTSRGVCVCVCGGGGGIYFAILPFIQSICLHITPYTITKGRYQDNYPPDNYPPDNYPRTNTPRTITPLGQIPPGHLPPPPEKFFKHLPWYSLYLYSSYSFLLGRPKYPFFVSYHKPFCVL